MRAIIDIALAVIFSVAVGTSGAKILSTTIKKEALIKIHGGLPSLESFTKKMTD